jgi:hypothetical protein
MNGYKTTVAKFNGKRATVGRKVIIYCNPDATQFRLLTASIETPNENNGFDSANFDNSAYGQATFTSYAGDASDAVTNRDPTLLQQNHWMWLEDCDNS